MKTTIYHYEAPSTKVALQVPASAVLTGSYNGPGFAGCNVQENDGGNLF